MTRSTRHLLNRLPLRMASPTVVVILLLGAGLYLFVLRSVSKFADEQIREALSDIASKIYDICDENFSELMQSGEMDDPRAVRIKKAFTLGAMEDFVNRNKVGCRVIDANGDVLLLSRIDSDLLAKIGSHPIEGPAVRVDDTDKDKYFDHFTFKPWEWHIDLVKDIEAYTPLIRRVKIIYIVTGELLICGLILILILQDRLLRRPLDRIIGSVQAGRVPDYRGVYEFEFLSDSISAMMRTLEERNRWIEKLYRIAITQRGKEFFARVADALSEALNASTLIVTVRPPGDTWQPIASSRWPPEANRRLVGTSSLPIRQIVGQKEPVVMAATSDLKPFSLPSQFPAGPAGYAGVPIISREGEVIGVVNVIAANERTFSEWTLNIIRTVCQMVAVELEFSAREKDRLRLEAQLQKSQKMEAIGTLAGGVAHDLNNILSGIVSYPDLLLIDLPPESPLRKPIHTIKQSGERAAVIVQDLLTLARRGVAISEVVNLNAIIAAQLKSPEFEKLLTFHPLVTVNTSLEPELLNIKGSATHVAKSIMNLVSNAAEAMPEGGEILIATQNRYIDRPIRGYDHVETGDYVTVTVRDTGIGISSEDRDRIFEPFYTKKVMGRSGTGLGMAVVWGTIKDHNGYIDLESTEGRGTTFTLYFPVTREPIRAQPSEPAAESYMGKREVILVVDDVKEQRELVSEILTRLNYTVDAVASGEAAIAYLEKKSVDLLILDMIMDPGLDGLETYRKIIRRHPGQKAIIASGFSETNRVRSAQRLGAGPYIKKPYTLEKIGFAVRSELDRPPRGG